MAAVDYSENPITGSKGRKQSILKRLLFVDSLYQRDRCLTKELRMYAQHFDWSKFGEIVIADYGIDKPATRRYAIVDGQGRWMMANLRDEISSLPCLIYEMNPMESALLYYALNTDRKNPTSAEKYKAALVFKDPIALELDRILVKYRVAVTKSKHPRSLDAVASCLRGIKNSRDDFERTIDILSEVCRNYPISQYLILGTFYLVRNIDGMGNNGMFDKFKKRMCHIGAERLIEATTRATVRLQKGDRAIAECMLDAINFKLKEDNVFYLRSAKPK